MEAPLQLERWLDQFIIGHQICPFAQRPRQRGIVRLQVVESSKEELFTQALLQELLLLSEQPAAQLSTTLLAAPNLFADFEDFHTYVEWTQELLVDAGLEGIVQIIGFHPNYYFADADPHDLANYTNRSPFPILHLLREEEIEWAATTHPNIESIPKRNIAYLRRLDRQTLEQLTGQ